MTDRYSVHELAWLNEHGALRLSAGAKFDALITGFAPAIEAPSGPDAFEIIVGVPLDDWMAADTHQKLSELLDTRDTKEAGNVPGKC